MDIVEMRVASASWSLASRKRTEGLDEFVWDEESRRDLARHGCKTCRTGPGRAPSTTALPNAGGA